MKKINLKNLHEATAQEVFNQVSSHLMTQNAKSEEEKGYCKYKSQNGFKCAAGCLIDDDEYNPGFEQNTWGEVQTRFGISSNHTQLISDLQVIHDLFEPYGWKDELIKLAKEYDLNYSHLITDPIIDKVIEKIKSRSQVGIKKYGTTLEKNNTDDFLTHLQEELMDAINYIEKLKSIRSKDCI